jgi:hypothetical protein
MRPTVTRREAVLLGGLGVLTSLAGCVGGGDAPPDDDEPDGGAGESGGTDGATGGDSSGPDGGGGDEGETADDGADAPAAAVQQAVVGDLTDLGPVAVGVVSAERSPTAPLLGPGSAIGAAEGNEYVALDVGIRGDAYLALAADLFAVAIDDTEYTSAENFAQIASPELGGFPFAPGELRRFRLHYEVPEGTSGESLRVLLRARTLPAESFESLQPLQVDLGSAAASAATFEQAFDVPLQSFGETVVHEGIEVTVGELQPVTDVNARRPSAEGTEYLGFTIAATNGGDRPNPILLSLSGFGGLSLVDGTGEDVGRNVQFTGEVLGGRQFDPSNGLAPGESESGVVVGEVPAGVSPLYLVWSPPALYWRGAVHRYVWQVR